MLVSIISNKSGAYDITYLVDGSAVSEDEMIIRTSTDLTGLSGPTLVGIYNSLNPTNPVKRFEAPRHGVRRVFDLLIQEWDRANAGGTLVKASAATVPSGTPHEESEMTAKKNGKAKAPRVAKERAPKAPKKEKVAKAPKAAKPPKEPKAPKVKAERKPRENTKGQELIRLMSRANGASMPAMIEALGWQAHTVRAAICRLRATGAKIEISKNGVKDTVYTMATQG